MLRTRWLAPTAPMNIAVYVTWGVVALQPLLGAARGTLSLTGPTAVGLVALLSTVPLWWWRTRCSGGQSRAALLLVGLQALAVLCACWGLRNGAIPILLIIVAAQLGALCPMRRVAGLMLPVNLALLLILAQRWGWSDAVQSVLSTAAFQTFAALMTAYAHRAEDARDDMLRINGELLATRQLLLESTRGEERLRLSRELHDVVGHKLTALNLLLRLQARDNGRTPALDDCERLAGELLADVRGVVSTLREHDGIDLHGALQALVPAIPEPRVVLDLAPRVRVTGLAQAQTLLRCAQEGLTNAMRHSGAERVTIQLREADGGVVLEVDDDGTARALPTPGNGLRGMRERVEAVDGRLDFTLRAGGGLGLRVWLPQAVAA
ncbi:sensor histidine kinase [Solimonas marina]|uniref:Sensor histidine kinase n=1 Tax=Solimonas marina TaxID=2714601 RepID=A0A969W808_9GAMM|nr:histidine kinase [Solimonas marina]NKF21183.1 sensor histidine kinase [Solimonas marina]